MNMTDSPHFFYGSAVPIKLVSELEQYALYEPITDRFVLVSKSKDVLEQLALLFSSRYHLYVCNLHTATNFEADLIDNVCCYNWTIGDKTGLRLNETIQTFTDKDIFNVSSLVASEPIQEDDLLSKDRIYFMAAHNWISDGEFATILNGACPFYKAELQMQKLITLPMERTRSSLILQEISDIIFTEYDFLKAEEKINMLLQEIM